MSQKLLFIFNPHSGKGQIKNNLVEIIDTMVKADFEVTVYTTQAQGDAIQKVAAEAANYDRIVCSGGDGTLDEVMTGLIQRVERMCRSVIYRQTVPMILPILLGFQKT